MRWYVNDRSLQGQFPDPGAFETLLHTLLSALTRNRNLRADLRITYGLPARLVSFGTTLRAAVQNSRDRDLRAAILSWLDRAGPFMEDDRLFESEDYFEYAGIDITDTGLGEAARRSKARDRVATFSFPGGAVEFGSSPLVVDHGLEGDRLGAMEVENLWTIESLIGSSLSEEPPSTSWQELIETARRRFPRLSIANDVYLNPALASQPFDTVIRDRALVLFGYLDAYMGAREPNGAEGAAAREIIDNFFSGDRALFSGESATNKRVFEKDLTFRDPDDPGREVFAHWHGKINQRAFRMHFEWPIRGDAARLRIFYLGPKITKH